MKVLQDLKPSDSCIKQLLPIAQKIYTNHLTEILKLGVFLDISKTFDKVLHEGLDLKLKQNVISGNLLNLLCETKNKEFY